MNGDMMFLLDIFAFACNPRFTQDDKPASSSKAHQPTNSLESNLFDACSRSDSFDVFDLVWLKLRHMDLYCENQ